MAGINSSETNPISDPSLEQMLEHYRTGGGATVYVDLGWYMNEGPGADVGISSAQVIRQIGAGQYAPGTSIQLSADAYERTRALEPDEFSHSFYDSHGHTHPYSEVYGDASFVIRGLIEVIAGGACW